MARKDSQQGAPQPSQGPDADSAARGSDRSRDRASEDPAPGGDPPRPVARDEGFRSTGTRVGDLDDRGGRVAPGERRDGEGAIPDRGMDRDSGAGSAGGHDSNAGRGGAAGSPRSEPSARDAGGSDPDD